MKLHRNCEGNHPDLGATVSRREFVSVGAIAGLGLTLPNLMRLQAAGGGANAMPEVEAYKPIADSIIHIYLPGGMAHQESWDPKPFAAPDYRGPFTPIKTSIPGEYVGEKFQQIAKIMNKLTVIRSMTHGEAAHERGTHNMFTGYKPSPAIKFPSFGSVISHEQGSRNNLPPYVVVPSMVAPEQGTGYMSSAYGPFALGSDPADRNFTVRDLLTPKDAEGKRFERRRSLLGAVDEHFKSIEKSDSINAMDSFYQAAYGLISSDKAREAFDLKKESDKLRDEYGRNTAGQRFLLARRLVEAGVRMVSVNYGGWDHHANIKGAFEGQAPNFDVAFARLITDLEERGMLERTVVMVSSEFGRTPKINGSNGRDHWPRVFSVALAGGGFKKGYIHGASDALGGEPDRDAVSPMDLAKTMYRLLGINGDKRIMSDGARPIDIVNGGRIMTELFA
ncbi:sulfatase [Verrucomicrobiaceae bacterium SCGC AG-212-N21]|nr:sulfatase [Verrucomicrobiaceae bacterium SCGC AG-212-N21]